MLENAIDHFTVVCIVSWPSNESEPGVDLLSIETSVLFLNDAVLLLLSRNLHKKRSKVSNKTRSTTASLPFKGLATEQTTVKMVYRKMVGTQE